MIDKRYSFGSLFKYDPSTNQTTVLLRGLEVASVVAGFQVSTVLLSKNNFRSTANFRQWEACPLSINCSPPKEMGIGQPVKQSTA
ncbi:unnamed protein product [Lupinus luteus]|uniref:Uncharacterized protein n=1 Tax=Lupinus luteus TaxID=3873 RepID=A0AAV1W1W2_LUPLU